jgi:UDP-N-acetylglucosamine--N-acetylmuramyl-(pentapeptide) pyrophosphoryl-undecaprenol N-acetylglucosamine transferase
VLQGLHPDLVLGIGGHSSGPVGVAAYTLGIPLAIHEQNAFPGFANRMLARLAAKVFLSFPDQSGLLPAARCTLTGNPIRAEFFQAAAARAPEPFTVLVMGGSQGAHHLNVEMLAALPGLADLKERLHFLHLTGTADEEMVRAGYHQSGFSAEVADFTTEVAGWMGRAHLLVCRAGASTLAELSAVGRGALLVPYPFAANNHQEYNARFLEEAGGAEVILNKDLRGELVAFKIRAYVACPEALARLEGCSRNLARPQAARDIVAGCMALLGVPAEAGI